MLEKFQWDKDFDREKVLEELADVMIYSILMADTMDADIIKIPLIRWGVYTRDDNGHLLKSGIS